MLQKASVDLSVFLLTVWIVLAVVQRVNTACIYYDNKSMLNFTDESRLIHSMLNRQQQYASILARPVFESQTVVDVGFSYLLYDVINLDDKGGVLTTKLWTYMTWKNQFITWNPQDHNNISSIRVTPDCIWMPDIMLMNNAGSVVYREGVVRIYSDGLSYFNDDVVYSSSCQIDITRFPFDVQNCTLVFASWTYLDDTLHLFHSDDFVENNMESFLPNSQWDVLETGQYTNSHDSPDGNWHDLTFFIVLRRRPGFYVYVLIIPSLLLSLMAPALFLMPSNRPDRTSLGLSMFSSFFVLLLVLVQILPSSSSNSKLGAFYCFSMALIAISTILSVIVIYISNNNIQKPVPLFIVKIVGIVESISTPVIKCRFKRSNAKTGVENRNDQAPIPNKDGITKNTDSASEQMEWKRVGILLDHLFFTLSTISVIVSVVVLFPR